MRGETFLAINGTLRLIRLSAYGVTAEQASPNRRARCCLGGNRMARWWWLTNQSDLRRKARNGRATT